MLFERVNKAHLGAVGQSTISSEVSLTSLALGEISIAETRCRTGDVESVNDWADVCFAFRSMEDLHPLYY